MKTKQEFINRFNNFLSGWQFTGTNPFSNTNLKNGRLCNALCDFAAKLFGDDDIIALQELFESLPLSSMIIEQAAEKFANTLQYGLYDNEIAFIAGANSPEAKELHTKGMYSEEEVKKLILKYSNKPNSYQVTGEEWFEHNKKQ